MKSESKLKHELCNLLKQALPGSVVFRHEDQFTAGIPDISVTWGGITVWIEVKLAKPSIKGREIQLMTGVRLDGAGNCIYVVYELRDNNKKTRILKPKEIFVNRNECMLFGIVRDGWDHSLVLEHIKEIQGAYR